MVEDISVSLSPISNMRDVETVRTHRNACKDFMTRNTEYISSEQQAKWYYELDKDNNRLLLLNKIHHGAVVEDIGYGYIRVENGEVLLTGGITSNERGKGYGYILFKNLVIFAEKYGLPIRLEVLKTNAAGIATYKKVGFKTIGEDDKIYRMEYTV